MLRINMVATVDWFNRPVINLRSAMLGNALNIASSRPSFTGPTGMYFCLPTLKCARVLSSVNCSQIPFLSNLSCLSSPARSLPSMQSLTYAATSFFSHASKFFIWPGPMSSHFDI